MKCPNCEYEFELESNKKYVKKNKEELQDYPNCFDNFMDCPEQPENINDVNVRCKMCPYYQYSNFRKDKMEINDLKPKKTKSKEEVIFNKEIKEMLKSLTKEQQDELLEKIKNQSP